eukprot:6906710-Alexandrium_andersonii.AAC.1
MSASLVGSEMCIRDSTLDVHDARTCLLSAVALEPHADVATACGRGRAVSYTHLTLPTICSV